MTSNAPLMKAVVVNPERSAGEISELTFIDVDLAQSTLKPNDLRVKVMAAGVNPIDLKMCRSAKAKDLVLGWDVAGVVESVGQEANLFQVGDEVFYAGSITRSGGFSQLQVVDERIVGKKPKFLSFSQAAALPLTSLTSWEAIFEKMAISRGVNSSATLLVLAGSGGIGSIAIQLGAKVAGLKVIASASREESRAHCLSMGAAAVIDHNKEIAQQIKDLGLSSVDYILCATDPAPIFDQLAEAISPLGKICCLVESSADLPMNLLRNKGVSFSWEGAFTRSLFRTKDVIKQHEILNEISELVDSGVLRSTLNQDIGKICASNITKACQMLAAGNSVGKIVMSGFN